MKITLNMIIYVALGMAIAFVTALRFFAFNQTEFIAYNNLLIKLIAGGAGFLTIQLLLSLYYKRRESWSRETATNAFRTIDELVKEGQAIVSDADSDIPVEARDFFNNLCWESQRLKDRLEQCSDPGDLFEIVASSARLMDRLEDHVSDMSDTRELTLLIKSRIPDMARRYAFLLDTVERSARAMIEHVQVFGETDRRRLQAFERRIQAASLACQKLAAMSDSPARNVRRSLARTQRSVDALMVALGYFVEVIQKTPMAVDEKIPRT